MRLAAGKGAVMKGESLLPKKGFGIKLSKYQWFWVTYSTIKRRLIRIDQTKVL